nr:NepR family anti-sigma factor [Gluconacetobacter johannae]
MSGQADGDRAFILWLRHRLRGMFGHVADEPIPDNLLHILRNPDDTSDEAGCDRAVRPQS